MIAVAGRADPPLIHTYSSRELFGCIPKATQKSKNMYILISSLATNTPEPCARLRMHRQRQRTDRRSVINKFNVLEHLSSLLQIIQNQLPVVLYSNKRATKGENGIFGAYGVSIPQRTPRGTDGGTEKHGDLLRQ